MMQLGVGQNIINEITRLQTKLKTEGLSQEEQALLEEYEQMLNDFAFSYGARQCIGIHFAKAEIIRLLTALAHARMTIRANEEPVKPKLHGGANTPTGKALKVKAEKRQAA